MTTPAVFVVPAGNVFAMGDNRDNSLDSRVPPHEGGVGFVPVENLVGRAEIRWFSFDDQDPWWIMGMAKPVSAIRASLPGCTETAPT